MVQCIATQTLDYDDLYEEEKPCLYEHRSPTHTHTHTHTHTRTHLHDFCFFSIALGSCKEIIVRKTKWEKIKYEDLKSLSATEKREYAELLCKYASIDQITVIKNIFQTFRTFRHVDNFKACFAKDSRLEKCPILTEGVKVTADKAKQDCAKGIYQSIQYKFLSVIFFYFRAVTRYLRAIAKIRRTILDGITITFMCNKK